MGRGVGVGVAAWIGWTATGSCLHKSTPQSRSCPWGSTMACGNHSGLFSRKLHRNLPTIVAKVPEGQVKLGETSLYPQHQDRCFAVGVVRLACQDTGPRPSQGLCGRDSRGGGTENPQAPAVVELQVASGCAAFTVKTPAQGRGLTEVRSAQSHLGNEQRSHKGSQGTHKAGGWVRCALLTILKTEAAVFSSEPPFPQSQTPPFPPLSRDPESEPQPPFCIAHWLHIRLSQ